MAFLTKHFICAFKDENAANLSVESLKSFLEAFGGVLISLKDGEANMVQIETGKQVETFEEVIEVYKDRDIYDINTEFATSSEDKVLMAIQIESFKYLLRRFKTGSVWAEIKEDLTAWEKSGSDDGKPSTMVLAAACAIFEVVDEEEN